jgi:5-methylcytosine-specific restriction endonuclease McrA
MRCRWHTTRPCPLVERMSHKLKPKMCIGCDSVFQPKDSRHATYCSRACAFEHQEQWQAEWTVQLTLPLRMIASSGTPACLDCGGLTPRERQHGELAYCSRACSRRAQGRIRDRRIRNNEGAERFSPREVFERDDYVCWLCLGACDRDAVVPSPYAATIDHVIALACGGQHSRSNVRCAHFICNCRRGSAVVAGPKCASENVLGPPVIAGTTEWVDAQFGEMKSGQNFHAGGRLR